MCIAIIITPCFWRQDRDFGHNLTYLKCEERIQLTVAWKVENCCNTWGTTRREFQENSARFFIHKYLLTRSLTTKTEPHLPHKTCQDEAKKRLRQMFKVHHHRCLTWLHCRREIRGKKLKLRDINHIQIFECILYLIVLV